MEIQPLTLLNGDGVVILVLLKLEMASRWGLFHILQRDFHLPNV